MKNVMPKVALLGVLTLFLAGCNSGGGGTQLASSDTGGTTLFTGGSGSGSAITLGDSDGSPVPLPQNGANGTSNGSSPGPLTNVPEPTGVTLFAIAGLGLVALTSMRKIQGSRDV